MTNDGRRSAAESARKRSEALRAAQERQHRQRTLLSLVAGFVVLVLIGVAVLFVISRRNKEEQDRTAAAQAAQTEFINRLVTIPAATFDKVGAGTATAAPKATGGPADVVDGKPRVLYIGAEYCPFCAMERWALVAALSRFGEFSGLEGAVSSPDEGELSNLQTVSFVKASYTSKYLAFKGWETSDRLQQPLQELSAADEALFKKYNAQGSIPFVLYGGTSSTVGATWNGQAIIGKTNTQITEAMLDPTSEIGRGADGAANVITAQLCQLTKQQPADVCGSAGVKTAAAKLTVK